MGQTTGIEWCDHTFNPWRGCTKVSPECAHCYADTLSKRNPLTLGVWGPNGTRVVAAESAWREPMKWNEAAKRDGVQRRVFCASLADVFEEWAGPMLDTRGRKIELPTVQQEQNGDIIARQVSMADTRARLFRAVHDTPNLNWLLLTKRPENILEMLEDSLVIEQGGDPKDANFFAEHGEAEPKTPAANMLNEWIAGDPPSNVWLGTTVGVRDQKKRIDVLRNIPAAVRFLSIEPLLEDLGVLDLTGIHWVIAGGESGPGARPMHPDWARSIRDQCQAAGVAFFFKQWGDLSPFNQCATDIILGETPRIDLPMASGMTLPFYRVGKKHAGRMLDGREWSEFPEVKS